MDMECGVSSNTMALPTNTASYLYFGCTKALQCNSRLKPLNCIPLQQQVSEVVMCECCSGRGWVPCDFCKGQKTNVRAENNRIYRRCPSCRAIGSILCSKCKVYKCVSFPDHNDGLLST